MSVAATAVEGAGTSSNWVIPNDFNASQIDVSTIAVPRFPEYRTNALFKEFQSNPTADPSVITDLSVRVTDLCRMQTRLDKQVMLQTEQRVVAALIWIGTALLIMGLVLAVHYNASTLLIMNLSTALAGGVIGGGISLVLPRAARNYFKKHIHEQTPIVKEAILAAAQYLQDNSAAIIKGLNEKIETLEKQLQSIEEPLQSINAEEFSGVKAGITQAQNKIEQLKRIKKELEVQGQAMLDQLSGNARHRGYCPPQEPSVIP